MEDFYLGPKRLLDRGRSIHRRHNVARCRSEDPLPQRLRKICPKWYQHEPLKNTRSIRLLQIIAFDDESMEVFAQLKAYDLDELPKYASVSYTWETAVAKYPEGEGDILPQRPCICLYIIPDHQPKPLGALDEMGSCGLPRHIDRQYLSQVSIIYNLSDFLLSFLRNHQAQSKLEAPALLWIDAICIDQWNASEKTDQIDLMGDIYSKATKTYIWLGFDEKDLDIVKWFIKTVLPAVYILSRDHFSWKWIELYKWLAQYPPDIPAFWKNYMSLDPFKGRTWRQCWYAYFRFFRHRYWFHRAWVLQEASLSRRPEWYVGRSFVQLDWNSVEGIGTLVARSTWDDTLVSLLRKENDNPTHTVSLMRDFGISDIAYMRECLKNQIDKTVEGYMDQSRLIMWWHLLLAARRRQCRYPQDKIYATLGMIRTILPDGVEGPMSADPSKSIQQVYEAAAGFMLQRMDTLAMLAVVEDRSLRLTPNLASWCPDFNLTSWGFPIGSLFLDYNASGFKNSTKTAHDIILDGPILKIHGKRIGKITALDDCIEFWRCSPLWIKVIEPLGRTYKPTGQDMLEALARTLVFNVYSFKNQTIDWSTFKVYFGSWLLGRLAEGYYYQWQDPQFNEAMDKALAFFEGNDLVPSLYDIHSKASNPGFKLGRDYPFESLCLLLEKVTQRYFFSTDSGYLGVARSSAKLGDEVWLLERGTCAYVLRPEEGGRYSFCGDAYVHGVMDSEQADGEYEQISII